MSNGLLDKFQLPEGVAEDIAKQGLREVELESGVSRLMSGSDGGVAYRFFLHTEYNKMKSDAAGYEVFDEKDAIQWLVDRRTKPVELVKFLPSELLSFNRHGELVGGRYKEAYERYLEGRAAPGIPLKSWGVLSDGEVASFEADGIFTVEQLAEQPDSKIEGVYPDSMVQAFHRAVQHVASKDMRAANDELHQKLLEETAKNSKLEERLAALEEQIANPKAIKPTAKKRGRPRKEAKEVIDKVLQEKEE